MYAYARARKKTLPRVFVRLRAAANGYLRACTRARKCQTALTFATRFAICQGKIMAGALQSRFRHSAVARSRICCWRRVCDRGYEMFGSGLG